MKKTAMYRPHRLHSTRGFTLVELMIGVAIVAVLAAVAVPQYNTYVTRSRLADASTGLATMRAQMERYFQDNRTFANVGTTFISPCNNATVSTRTFGSFVISCINTLDANQFTLQATGSGPVSDFKFTINHQDVRATTAAPTGWGTCTSKWIMKKGDAC